MLWYIYGVKDTIDEVGVTVSDEKRLLRGVIISVSHMIYLSSYFDIMSKNT